MLPCRDGTLRDAFGKKNECEVTSILASTRAKVTLMKSHQKKQIEAINKHVKYVEILEAHLF